MTTPRNRDSSGSDGQPERKRSKWSMPTVMPSAPPARRSSSSSPSFSSDDPPPKMNNTFAVTALVLGLVSIVGVYLLGILDVAIILLAIVFAILAILKVRRGESNRMGYAITGLATGILGAVIIVIAIIVSRHVIQDCKAKLHLTQNPTSAQLKQCQNDKSSGNSMSPNVLIQRLR